MNVITANERSKEVEIDIKPDFRGEYFDNEHDGLLLVNLVADTVKELVECSTDFGVYGSIVVV